MKSYWRSRRPRGTRWAGSYAGGRCRVSVVRGTTTGRGASLQKRVLGPTRDMGVRRAARWVPPAARAGSSFCVHGASVSRPIARHRRTALTLRQRRRRMSSSIVRFPGLPWRRTAPRSARPHCRIAPRSAPPRRPARVWGRLRSRWSVGRRCAGNWYRSRTFDVAGVARWRVWSARCAPVWRVGAVRSSGRDSDPLGARQAGAATVGSAGWGQTPLTVHHRDHGVRPHGRLLP